METLMILSLVLVLVICTLGIIGNSFCLWVLSQKEMKASSFNYLLIGLGVSDLLLLVLSIVRTLPNFNLYPLDYSAVYIFIWDWICTGGTKWYTVAISLERYFVTCYPLKAHGFMTKRKAQGFAAGVCIFTLMITLVSYFYNFYWDPMSFHIYTAITLHFTPFVALIILNVSIYLGLRQFQKERKNLTESETTEISVTKMLLVVVGVFGFCYTFEFIRRILNFTKYFQAQYHYHSYLINNLADIFYVLNSSVNFLIYYFLGRNFRKQFRKLISRYSCFKSSKNINKMGNSKGKQAQKNVSNTNSTETVFDEL